MFEVYRLPTLIIMSVVPPLISFWLTHTYKDAAAYLAALFINVGNLYVIVMYIAVMYHDYMTYTNSDQEEDTLTDRSIRSIPNLADEYNTTTYSVNWDAEKHFALTLVQQHANRFEVNMTETYWLKAGRWLGTQEEFRTMLHKWQLHKIAEKQGRRLRGRWEVKDWPKVRRIAAGEKLITSPTNTPPTGQYKNFPYKVSK